MLTQSGAGTLKLTGANMYSGNTVITGGTLEIGSAGTLGVGTYGGTISNGGALIFNTSSDQTLTGVISGNGVLTQSGVGTLKLTGANTYSGNTISKGVIRVSNNSALGSVNSSAWVEVFSGAALELDNVTIGNKEL